MNRFQENTGLILVLLAVALAPWSDALAGGSCSPDSGFEWCYQEASWSPAFCKIQVDTDYNTAWIKGYKVAAKGYQMRFRCSGTTFYGPSAFSCSSGGCGSENLGGGTAVKTIASPYTANSQMQRVSCHHQASGWWCYAGYYEWSSGVHSVHCYDDSHCGCGKYCSTSGGPSGWQCITKSETCNGADDDCDGSVDEGFNVGQGCTVGVGECVNTGSYICNISGNGTQCSASPKPSSTEICDGKDNDCDGSTDEGFNLGAPCTVGVGQCVNSGVWVCGGDGKARCSVEPLAPSAEKCDGKDNDCDSSTDEDFDLDALCLVGIGACQNSGVKVCKADGSGTQCSVEPFAPQAEGCDGIDNDCDNVMDEDFDLGDACTVGIGECENSGVKVCKADTTGTKCSVEPLAPTAEACDALDNDCDTSIDEDFDLGDACLVGIGECENWGVKVCKADTSGTECSVEPLAPTVELCDALDNDCDAEVDELFDVGAGCVSGIGQCMTAGVRECAQDGSGTLCTAVPLAPQDELCDVLDNDCDGKADEDFLLGAPCVEGVGECENIGELVCHESQADVVCSVEAGSVTDEVCDGKDNNCDGQIGEGWGADDPCQVDALSAVQPYAPSGDLDQDGGVDVVDMQCLVLIFDQVIEVAMAGHDLCESEWDCEAAGLPNSHCGPGFTSHLGCYPNCLHKMVSFGETDAVQCGDESAKDADCLGTVQKRSLDMDCDGELTVADLSFIVALIVDKAGGPGTSDYDNDGQLNFCDPDSDGDGLADVDDCIVLDPLVTDCDDSNPCTEDICIPEAGCEHPSNGACASGAFRVNQVAVDSWATFVDAATFADGTFVAVYGGMEEGAVFEDVFARRFDALGNPVGDEFLVNLVYGGPDDQASVAALTDGRFVVAWRGEFGVRVRVFDSDDTALYSQVKVSVNANEQAGYPTAITLADGGFVVAWQSLDSDGSLQGVFAQRFTASGEKHGEEFRAAVETQGDQQLPVGCSMGDGGILLGWAGNGPGDDMGVFGRVFGNTLAPVGSDFILNETAPGEQSHPSVALLSDGRFVAAWYSEGPLTEELDVAARLFLGDGTPAGAEIVLSSDPAGEQDEVHVAPLKDGAFAAVWQSWGEGWVGPRVVVRVFDTNGLPVVDELYVDMTEGEHAWFPTVASFSHGGFVVLWHARFPAGGTPGIYGQLFALDGATF